MNTTRKLIAAAIVVAFPLGVWAQTTGSEVQRDINQQKRIEQGVQSGQLTNREVDRLERGEANVERREARAGADGHVGRGEQRNIQTAVNRQSRHIFHEKHNAHRK